MWQLTPKELKDRTSPTEIRYITVTYNAGDINDCKVIGDCL